jgi:hypothetical protein
MSLLEKGKKNGKESEIGWRKNEIRGKSITESALSVS